MPLIQIVHLTTVLLGTTILIASIHAGTLSLDEEAEVEAHKYLRTIFTQCSEDHFSKQVIPRQQNLFAADKTARKTAPDDHIIEQYHQLSTNITSKPLTTADTLNGIEWKGTIEVSAAAKREFPHGKGPFLKKVDTWSDWQAMTDSPLMRGWPGLWTGLHFSITKKQGEWNIGGSSTARQAPDCTTIPK